MEEDLPIDYASIGLMGLRKLPEENGSPQKDLPSAFFKGAVCLAEALGKYERNDYKEFWLREMRAVAAYYPRSREYWAKYFYPFLHGWNNDMLTEWLGKVFPKFNVRSGASKYIKPPTNEKRTHFLNLIKNNEPLENFRSDLEDFVVGHRRYAYLTGDSSFLVKTFSDIGYKLLCHDSFLALELIQEASIWDPYDPVLWSNLAIIEIFRGNESRAATLLWEAIRRFPENAEARNNLAHLLARQGSTG